MFHLLFIYLFFIVIVIIALRLLEIKGNVLSLPLMNRYFQTSFKETFTFISNFYKQTFIFSRCTKLQFCVFFIICSCSTFIGAERYYLFFFKLLAKAFTLFSSCDEIEKVRIQVINKRDTSLGAVHIWALQPNL